MSGLHDDGRASHQALDAAWQHAREHWTDAGARHFATNHLRPLEAEFQSCVEAMRRLLDVLNAAERATEY